MWSEGEKEPAAARIDGKTIAAGITRRVSEEATIFTAKAGRQPGLAVVLVGDNPASHVYVRNKAHQAIVAGMRSFEHRLSADTSMRDLVALVNELNYSDKVDGILVQLPLPPHIDARQITNMIDPAKDVDGFHPMNAGLLATGGDALVPCTPLGCMMLARSVMGDLTGIEAVVVGRSNIVGKPMAQLLIAANATVTVAHSGTHDLTAVCRRADLLVVAVGRAEMVRGDWIKPGAVVVDVGVNRIAAPELGPGKSRLVGDVAYSEALRSARAITPVPGGVGPMTIACLLKNTMIAASRRAHANREDRGPTLQAAMPDLR